MNAFVLLIIAIIAELCGTTAMKLSDGFTRFWPVTALIAGYGIAFWLMSIAIKTIPVGVAYAIWAGLGTAGIAIIGAVYFNEHLGAIRIFGICLIIAGVVVLNLYTPGNAR